ncbi:MAG: hypothetical protein MUC50_17495 [Myxococcota bacterium]|jgi:hypothetical protein|nr:hypothetical protein [Myxococcota bacterium]
MIRGVFTAMLVALLWLPSTSFAQDENEQQARTAFQEGVEAFNQGLLAEALELFHRAYATNPSFRILYNIAQTEAELGRPHKAIATFEAYLAEGTSQIPRVRRQQVKKEIARLAILVGSLNVAGPDGSELWVDGERIGVLPLGAPILLPSGEHRVSVLLPGFEACERSVVVPNKGNTAELCHPRPAEPPRPEEPPAPVIELKVGPPKAKLDAARLGRIAAWSTAGLGVVCLSVGIALMAKTSALNAELHSACPNNTCPQSRSDDVNALPKLAGGADAMIISTAVLTAAATILFLTPWKKKPPSKRTGGEP